MIEILIGIDPGKSGSIAYISKEKESYTLVDLYNIPTSGKKKDYSIEKLASILIEKDKELKAKGYDLQYAIEKVYVHRSSGRKAAFNFGFGFGLIEGILGTMKVDLHEIRPIEWKKVFGITEKEQALDKIYEYIKRIDDIISSSPRLRKVRIDQAESMLIAIAGDVGNLINKGEK